MSKDIKMPQKKIEAQLKIRFLEDILDTLINQRNSYDLRTQIIMGISGGIFILALQNVFSLHEKGIIGFIVIAISSLLACILAIFALRPPDIFINKKRLAKSILHHSSIAEMSSSDFRKKITATIQDSEKMIDEYSNMIYNLSTYITVRKKYFINQSGHVLILGLSIGFILIFLLP